MAITTGNSKSFNMLEWRLVVGFQRGETGRRTLIGVISGYGCIVKINQLDQEGGIELLF